MNRIATVLVLFFLTTLLSKVNGQYTISGFVKAEDSKEHLINALIFNPETQQSVLTNEYGFFSISIENNSPIELAASYVGYHLQTKKIKLVKDTTINFFLSTTSLREIEVVARKNSIQNNQIGRNTIPIERLSRVPSLIGEPDVLKSLSILSGVSLGSEGNSNIFVRGGTPDQNLILIDDVPVYNATHLFSFFSVFNSDALNKVDLLKGGFPARYGGRLSSIIDVDMKEGNKEQLKGNFGIGLLTSNLTMEGPIKKEKSSFLLATRASYLGLINFFRKKESQETYLDYWLYDVNAKTSFLLPKGKLLFTLYHGNDFETSASNRPSTQGDEVLKLSKSDDRLNWGNTVLASRYITDISSNIFLSIQGGYTKYKFRNKLESEIETYGDIDTLIQNENSNQQSTINDFILKGQIDITPNTKYQFRLGASVIYHLFNISNSIEKTMNSKNSMLELNNYETIGYIENTTQWSKAFTTTIGVHWNGYFTRGKNFYSLQPRILSKYQVSKNISLQAAYAKMQQNIHLLSNSGFSFPSDIWIPATKDIAPAESHQLDAGIFFNIKNLFHISLEAFFKKQLNLIDFRNNQTNIFENMDRWESLIEANGVGEVKGIELMIRKSIGRLQGLLSYTLSRNERQFENINMNKKYLFRYHRPHDLNINLLFSLNAKWSFSTNWIYQTGRRVTLPIGTFPGVGNRGGSNLIFGEKNNGKFPDYHRLDIGFIYKKNKKKNRKVEWSFNIYNAYNHQNTNYLSFDKRPIFDDQQNFLYSVRNVTSVNLFTIIPSLSYKYIF